MTIKDKYSDSSELNTLRHKNCASQTKAQLGCCSRSGKAHSSPAVQVDLNSEIDLEEIKKKIGSAEMVNISALDLMRLVEGFNASKKDGLTRLSNKVTTLDFLDKTLEIANRYNHDLSVLMIDMDKFKSINDTHGHLVGDEVLKHVSSIISNCVRSADIIGVYAPDKPDKGKDEASMVGRFGGEEFIAVLPETPKEGAFILAERIRKEVNETPFECVDLIEPLTLSVSIGVANKEKNQTTSSANLVKQADKALYDAKNSGRNKTILAV